MDIQWIAHSDDLVAIVDRDALTMRMEVNVALGNLQVLSCLAARNGS